MLAVSEVEVRYGTVHGVGPVSITLGAGEIVALLGVNGGGKSTLLRAISGLSPVVAGSIIWLGRRIDNLPAEQVTRLGIGLVPEGRQICPGMSVAENLLLGSFSRQDREAVRRDLALLYERFSILAERRTQAAGTLSGGEQQLLSIARALLAAPRLLLLDEASAGLAPRLLEEVFDVVVALRRSGGSVLLAEQNAKLALSVADRGYVLEGGRVVREAAAMELERGLLSDWHTGGDGAHRSPGG